MDRFRGLIGIAVILVFAYLVSNNRKAINKKIVFRGLLLQVALAFFILKVPYANDVFVALGTWITKVINLSQKGGEFVFGFLTNTPKLEQIVGKGNGFIFFFKIMPTIIFVSTLVAIGYYFGLIQRIINLLSKVIYHAVGVTAVEAISNVASIFIGQVEAQILIKPYLPSMTNSQILASMAGSMACIAGGVMAIYIALGVPAPFLIAASIMAAPGALVISKIIYPETEAVDMTKNAKLYREKETLSFIEIVVNSALDGLKVVLNLAAVLIVFISLIALVDAGIGLLVKGILHFTPTVLGYDIRHFGLNTLLGGLFSGIAYIMGVPVKDMIPAGTLMGIKLVSNEFIAYLDFAPMVNSHSLDPKTITIISFALCGFANFSSIGIQVGGIGALAPSRQKDLAKLAPKALLAGTLTSYMSAAIAGIIY